jgi:hypothetical protein
MFDIAIYARSSGRPAISSRIFVFSSSKVVGHAAKKLVHFEFTLFLITLILALIY